MAPALSGWVISAMTGLPLPIWKRDAPTLPPPTAKDYEVHLPIWINFIDLPGKPLISIKWISFVYPLCYAFFLLSWIFTFCPFVWSILPSLSLILLCHKNQLRLVLLLENVHLCSSLVPMNCLFSEVLKHLFIIQILFTHLRQFPIILRGCSL